jgi:L-amino acid N-acyltransferase YncA
MAERQACVGLPSPAPDRKDDAMEIRAATAADVPEIQAIYAHHVTYGAGSFEETPPSVEEMARRHQAIVGRGWSYLVATDATGVVGYGYYSQFRERSAYRFTAEDSIYVRDDVRGQGVGKALVVRLLEDAERAGFRQMVAVIGDSENIGSIGVHSSVGFQRCGVLRSTGFKFGRWVDSVYMQRPLGRGDSDIPEG